MEFSIRSLKNRESFPIKIANVQCNQPLIFNTKRDYEKHLKQPFFARKMIIHNKKDETQKCLTILSKLKSIQAEQELRKISLKNTRLSGQFPKRQSFRIKSARAKFESIERTSIRSNSKKTYTSTIQ